jgi:predicted transcriptional regulator
MMTTIREVLVFATPAQLAAPRTLVHFSRGALAKRAGVSPGEIKKAELGEDIRVSSWRKIQQALESEGAEFCADGSVQIAAKVIRTTQLTPSTTTAE